MPIGNRHKWCITKLHGLWRWYEILCWHRFHQGADGRLSPLLFLPVRWEPIKGGEILRTPGLQFPNGYHVHIFEKDA